MGSIVKDNHRRHWEDIVAEKRRVQAESLAHITKLLSTGDGDQTSDGDGFVEGSELVARLASGEISCVALVKLHIKKSVLET